MPDPNTSPDPMSEATPDVGRPDVGRPDVGRPDVERGTGPGTTRWVAAVRGSHNRFAALVSPLSDDRVTAPSYTGEWSIAQVASHLGSQAEIFGLALSAGLAGTPAPGGETFLPIWDRWNALGPGDQVRASLTANEEFVARVEHLTAAERESFALAMFGTELDLAGMLAMRLGEHALHTWDVAVALDPAAVVAPDAVRLLIDTLPQTASRAGKPAPGAHPVPVDTVDPDRRFLLTVDPDVTLAPRSADGADALRLPAEAFVRLVYGRLDTDHTPGGEADDARLTVLRAVFPGF